MPSAPTSAPDLLAIREAIETLDARLLALLRERMELVEGVAQAKLAFASPLRDQQREEHVLARVRHAALELGLDPHEIERLYRLIMEMSIARQQAHIHSLPTAPIRVAYQGVEGSYSHLAAQRRYGRRDGGALLTGFETFRKAVEALRNGEQDVALLPIENTTAGSINETYDLLAEGGVTIIGEEVSEIEHCLLALPGVVIEDVRRVLSHPQALWQCDVFLRARPWLAPQTEFDTAGAARKVRQSGDRTLAAIASESAARRYGLGILARGIQTQSGNATRFVELAREAVPCPPGVIAKTSLLLVLRHQPGALAEVLMELARRNLNLTKLESRPVAGTPWQARFYLDIDGHAAADNVASALETLRSLTTELRVLGTFPRAESGGAGAL